MDEEAFTDQQFVAEDGGPSSYPRFLGKGQWIGIAERKDEDAGVDYGLIEFGGINAPRMSTAERRRQNWDLIKASKHPKFVPFENAAQEWEDSWPPGGHGDYTGQAAAAMADNEFNAMGAAPEAMVMIGYQDDLADAIVRMADQGVDVIVVPYEDCWLRRLATQYAVATGVVVVEAHGANSFGDLEDPKPYEAITVGSYTLEGYTLPSGKKFVRYDSVRSHGPGLSLLATASARQTHESRTSSIVGGVAALLLEKNNDWNPHDVHRALIQSAEKPAQMAGAQFDTTHGWGLLRAGSALELTLEELRPLPPVDVLIDDDYSVAVKVAWTNRPISRFAGTTIVGRLGAPPKGPTGNDLTEQVPPASQSAQVIPPGPGQWHFAVLAMDESGRFSEPADYVRFDVDWPA